MNTKNRDPRTAEECRARLVEIEAQITSPKEHWGQMEAHITDRKNWIAQNEKRGGHVADIKTHAAELANLESDAPKVAEYHRLHAMLPKLERAAERAERAGLIGAGAAGVHWGGVPSFAAALELPPAQPGVPDEVVAFLGGVVAEVNAAVKKFAPVTDPDLGPLGELDKLITIKAVDEIRAARRAGMVARANNAKAFILATRAALGKLIAFDPEEVARNVAAEIEAKAAALVDQIAAAATAAGLYADEALKSAQNAPKVCELLATLPTVGNAQALEDDLEALLLERADGARDALEKLIAALG